MAKSDAIIGFSIFFLLFASIGFGLLFTDAGLPDNNILMSINGWKVAVGTIYQTSYYWAKGDYPVEMPLVYYNYGGNVTVHTWPVALFVFLNFTLTNFIIITKGWNY
jgi:hypothetical protein